MLLARLTAVLLLLSMATASAAAPVTCPLRITVSEDVHPLSSARVFRGPVADRAELVAVHGHFEFGGIAGGKVPFNLVCVYTGTTEVQTMALPQDVSICDITDAGSGTRVGCH